MSIPTGSWRTPFLFFTLALARSLAFGPLGTGDAPGVPGAGLAEPGWMPVGTAGPSTARRDALTRDWPHQLTVYAVRAPNPVDWSSPGKLMGSALLNEITPSRSAVKRSLGHMFVRLQSGARDEFVGMTTASGSESRTLVLEKGYGLGILTADMMGRLEKHADLQAEVAAKEGLEGELAYLRVLLSAEQAGRLVRYLDEYKAQGLGEHYGGGNRPRYREGGGCAPFAYSFLEVAGLVEEEFDAWILARQIPRSLLGGAGRYVGPGAVADRGSWAAEGEDSLLWWTPEPHLVKGWIEATYRRQLAAPTGPWVSELAGYAKGVGLDARARRVPSEPIWLADPPGAAHPLGRQDGLVPRGSGAGPRP